MIKLSPVNRVSYIDNKKPIFKTYKANICCLVIVLYLNLWISRIEMRILFSFILLMSFSQSSWAQRVIQPKLVEIDWKGIVYKNEWSLDFRMLENGAAIAYNSGKIKSYYKTNYYHVELGFMKDPREKNQTKIQSTGRSGTFSYGKINNVINLRVGVGSKRYLSEKEKRKGLAVGYTYEIGPSIAFLKPYFLDLIEVQNIDDMQVVVIEAQKFSDDTADRFLDLSSISGRSSFFKGFNEMKVQAGLQGKLGAHFAMGAFDKYVKAFETGLMFDLFASKLPIMAETENVTNKQYFVRVYLNLQFGSRSN